MMCPHICVALFRSVGLSDLEECSEVRCDVYTDLFMTEIGGVRLLNLFYLCIWLPCQFIF